MYGMATDKQRVTGRALGMRIRPRRSARPCFAHDAGVSVAGAEAYSLPYCGYCLYANSELKVLAAPPHWCDFHLVTAQSFQLV